MNAASKNLVFSPLTDRGADIGLVMAWSQERENPVLKAFLDLVRGYGNWPRDESAAGTRLIEAAKHGNSH